MAVHRSPGSDSAVRQMPCPERARLLKAYAGASSELADLVANVATCAHSANQAFESAWSGCEIARFKCQEIQKRIYQHVLLHGCALEIAKSRVSRP